MCIASTWLVTHALSAAGMPEFKDFCQYWMNARNKRHVNNDRWLTCSVMGKRIAKYRSEYKLLREETQFKCWESNVYLPYAQSSIPQP